MPAANVAPYTIVAGAADVYVASVGTTPPAVNASPGTARLPLGKTDGGVKVKHSQTIVQLMTDQTTAPVKAVRSEEGLEVSFDLAEVTTENYAQVLNHAALRMGGGTTLESGVGPDKVVPLYRGGFGIETFALLIRGTNLSPEGNFNLQYEVPSVYQSEEPEVEYKKDDKAMLSCNFTAIAPAAFTPGFQDKDIFGVLRVGRT